MDEERQREKTGGGNEAPATRFTIGALLSYEHHGRTSSGEKISSNSPVHYTVWLEATGF